MFEVITGRRRFVKIAGAVAGTAAVAGAGVAGARLWEQRRAEEEAKLRTVPWPVKPIDPEPVAARALDGYHRGECMYGAFEALVGPVAERLGAPYTSFPFDLFRYGGGGVHGWGTLCGALNGTAAAFQLLSPEPTPLVEALFRWYERTALPDLLPRDLDHPVATSVAGSPLCHASVARWCEASGRQAFSAERKERCGLLTASVARHGAELLVAQAKRQPLPGGGAEAAAGCTGCHGEHGQVENARGKMDCSGCHFNLGTKHPEL